MSQYITGVLLEISYWKWLIWQFPHTNVIFTDTVIVEESGVVLYNVNAVGWFLQADSVIWTVETERKHLSGQPNT